MSFAPPVFNVKGNLWYSGHTPASDPPDASAIDIQLYVNPKAPFAALEAYDPPQNTDIQSLVRMSKADYLVQGMSQGCIWGLNDSSGSTWYYYVYWWDTIHLGFTNEYCGMLVKQCSNAGTFPDPNR
jgi:hypothetical protein